MGRAKATKEGRVSICAVGCMVEETFIKRQKCQEGNVMCVGSETHHRGDRKQHSLFDFKKEHGRTGQEQYEYSPANCLFSNSAP